MQRSTIGHPLIVQNNSTNQRFNWLHNSSTCPSTKSDLAQARVICPTWVMALALQLGKR
jgi:hypothetical protein